MNYPEYPRAKHYELPSSNPPPWWEIVKHVLGYVVMLGVSTAVVVIFARALAGMIGWLGE
jgi:hypothetical protein